MGGDSARAYARMMGVGFLRENGELQTWVARMGYLWFCAALRNNTVGKRRAGVVSADYCAS